MNALETSLETWTPEILRSLIGRREGQRLEIKGDRLDLSRPSGRSKVANEVAGMSTAAGGFIILGNKKGDVLTDLPGLEIDESDTDRLLTSLLDSVTPPPIIAGPQLFDADEKGKRIAVIQVHPHPSGRPAMSSDGRFYIRVDSETRKMSEDEVTRRIRAATDVVEPATTRAEGLIANQLKLAPNCIVSPPFAFALAPTIHQGDLGISGPKMREHLNLVSGEEAPSWNDTVENDSFLSSFAVERWPRHITQSGLRIEESQVVQLLALNSGSFGAKVDVACRWATAGPGELFLDYLAAIAARLAVLGLLFQRSLGLGGTSLALLHSGGVKGLTQPLNGGTRTTELPGGAVHVEYPFAIPVQHGSALVVEAGVQLVGQRLTDAANEGLEYQLPGWLRDYVRENLA